jgi:hypothetical protein
MYHTGWGCPWSSGLAYDSSQTRVCNTTAGPSAGTGHRVCSAACVHSLERSRLRSCRLLTRKHFVPLAQSRWYLHQWPTGVAQSLPKTVPYIGGATAFAQVHRKLSTGALGGHCGYFTILADMLLRDCPSPRFGCKPYRGRSREKCRSAYCIVLHNRK